MSQDAIESALLQKYLDGNFDLPTAYENTTFTPTAGEPWAQVYFVPNQPSPASKGPGGMDEHDGFLQINLNYPLGTGNGAARDKADEIRDHFVAGNRVNYSGQSVLIRSCGRGPGRNVDGWYRIVMIINWSAWTLR